MGKFSKKQKPFLSWDQPASITLYVELIFCLMKNVRTYAFVSRVEEHNSTASPLKNSIILIYEAFLY